MGRTAITFSKATFTTLTLRMPPMFPVAVAEGGSDVEERSAGNQTYVYGQGLDETVIVLEWTDKNPLKASVYDGGFNHSTRAQTGGTQSLVNWFDIVADEQENTFTFTDHRGLARTVRLLDKSMQFVQGEDLHYRGKLTLRVER